MAFRLEGTYLENCNCEVICPCTWSNLARPATYSRCTVLFVLHVADGEIDGVEVGGLSMGFIADTPPTMSDGGWRMGVLLDGAADLEQLDRLRRFMRGEYGGVPAALTGMVGEMLGEVVEPIEFHDGDGRHTLRIGASTDVTLTDVATPRLGAVQLKNVVHPISTTLTVGDAAGSRVSLLGIEYAGASGFSAPFSWTG